MVSNPHDQNIRSLRPKIFKHNEHATEQNRRQLNHGNHLQEWFLLHAIRLALLGLTDPKLGYGIIDGVTFGWKVFDGGIRSAEANTVQAKAQQSTEQGKLTKISNQPTGGGCLCSLCGFQDLGGCRPQRCQRLPPIPASRPRFLCFSYPSLLRE
jgi:hypothetical protein